MTIEAGATLGDSVAFNSSIVNMSGGMAGNTTLGATDSATVNMTSGGSNGGGALAASGQGQVSMSGGSLASIGAIQNGTIAVSGGSILAAVYLYDSSQGTSSVRL